MGWSAVFPKVQRFAEILLPILPDHNIICDIVEREREPRFIITIWK